MKSKKSILTLLILFCFVFCTFGSAVSETYKTYRDSKGKFSISHPVTWQRSTPEEITSRNQIIYSFMSPKEGPYDRGAENLSVATNTTPYIISLDQFAAGSLEGLKSEKILAQGSEVINGVKTRWIKYSSITNGINTTSIMYIFVKSNYYYILSGRSETTKNGKYMPIFYKMIRSFKI